MYYYNFVFAESEWYYKFLFLQSLDVILCMLAVFCSLSVVLCMLLCFCRVWV